MTTPRTPDEYGLPFIDAIPVDDPTTTESAAQHCLLGNDVACMTNTSTKAWVHFPTQNTNGVVGAIGGGSHMGIGGAQFPIVARTGTGIYTVTYPTSWIDNSGTIGQVGTTEAIYFIDSVGSVRSATVIGHVQTTENANVINVFIFDPKTSGYPASDLTVGTIIRVEGR